MKRDIMAFLSFFVTIAFFVAPVSGQQKPDRVKLDVEQFIKDLKNSDAKVRTNAAKSLGALGEKASAATSALCSATLDRSATVRRAALEALEKVNPELYSPISTIVLDNDGANLAKAIYTLAKMGQDAQPAIDFLLSKFGAASNSPTPFGSYSDSVFFKDAWKGYSDDLTRGRRLASWAEAFYRALITIAPEDERVIKLNKNVASQRQIDPNHRMVAIRFLYHRWAGDDETKRKEVYRFLKSAFTEASPSIEIIEMIADYGSLAKDFVPTLKRLKLSSDSEVREAAAKALEMIEQP